MAVKYNKIICNIYKSYIICLIVKLDFEDSTPLRVSISDMEKSCKGANNACGHLCGYLWAF